MDEIWQDLLHVRGDATLAIGFVLAISATIHILLTKREVASAVGWIGLLWFAPILGTITYLIFGVNRVRRRARMLRPAGGEGGIQPSGLPPEAVDGLDPLGRGVERITSRPLLPGTRVAAYRNGDNAYPPMLAAITAAKSSVGLSSYIFRNDEWGGRFIDALAAASRRGVAVRVLIDGIGGGWMMSPAYRRLRREGVTAARFMHSPLPWRMPFINLRNHKKILVVDGTTAFTGGMNIADENVMGMRPKQPVQDLHFRIEGPVVSQLVDAFAQDWLFVTGEDLEGEAWSPHMVSGTGCPARVIDSGPDEDLEKVEFAVMQAIACARTSIAIMTPYFLPDERLITALSLAAMRGVRAELVIPEASNHMLVDWATRPNIGPLLSDGVRIWKSPPPFHHDKIMVVDREWCLIGSCNWDIRSFRLNFELCLEAYDRDFSDTLTALMERARGAELTQKELESRSLPVRIRDAATRLMLPYL